MCKQAVLPICTGLVALSLQCSGNSGVGPIDGKDPLLEYQFKHGWTGMVSKIHVYEDKSAVRHSNDTSIAVQFTDTERRGLDALLSEFPALKRFYKPESGIWVDISTYVLIHHADSVRDTVSILEPLNSPDIPTSLRTAVNVLQSKLR